SSPSTADPPGQVLVRLGGAQVGLVLLAQLGRVGSVHAWQVRLARYRRYSPATARPSRTVASSPALRSALPARVARVMSPAITGHICGPHPASQTRMR